MSTTNKLFSTKQLCCFGLSDPAGILFFKNVFELAHQNLEQFISSSDFGWDAWFSNPEWAAPVIHCDAQYRSPILSGKELQVDLFLEQKKIEY